MNYYNTVLHIITKSIFSNHLDFLHNELLVNTIMKKLKNNKAKQFSFDGYETMKMKYHNNEDFFDVRDTRFKHIHSCTF